MTSSNHKKISKSVTSVKQVLKLPEGVLLGAHTSSAGGVVKAIDRAQECAFRAAQLFVKNNKQWFATPLIDQEVKEFNSKAKQAKLTLFAHNSYLINLASPKEDIFLKSVESMTAEVTRAEALELPFIVMHPGSHLKTGEEAGLKRITDGLQQVIENTKGMKCRLALEITAGQGSCIGHKLEHLSLLLQRATCVERLGICLDTAHLHAAGYRLHDREGWEETMNAVGQTVGFEQVLCWHFNDTKIKLGGRVDRHEHLGEGEIGLDCFKWILEDKRWSGRPMVLETPKSEDMHEDVENILKLASYLH